MFVAKTEQDYARMKAISMRYLALSYQASKSSSSRLLAGKRYHATDVSNIHRAYCFNIPRSLLITRHTRKKEAQLWGQAFAQAHAAKDVDEVLMLLSNPATPLVDTDVVDTLIELLKNSSSDYDDLFRCAKCGDVNIEEYRIYSTSHDGEVCEVCSEDHVRTCDTDEYIDTEQSEVNWAYTGWSGTMGQFIDPEPFMYTNDLYPIHPNALDSIEYVTYQAATESWWHFRDDSEGYGLHPEGEKREREHVYPYGQHPYRNTDYFAMPSESSLKNIPVGMELEVYCEGDIFSAISSANLDWILEEDGSLDAQNGVEIVSPPLLYKSWEGLIPKLCEGLSSEDVDAYDAQGEYGIHLTVHRKWLTPLQEARMLMFLLAQENADFVRAVAQRWDIYNSSSHGGIGVYPKERQRIGEFGHIDSNHRLNCTNWKYMPLHFKGFPQKGLAEFRIFQSTIAPSSILKNIQFVLALTSWTNVKSATGKSWHHMDFYKWLTNSKDTYPDLALHLQKDTYRVKHSISEIVNTWK